MPLDGDPPLPPPPGGLAHIESKWRQSAARPLDPPSQVDRLSAWMSPSGPRVNVYDMVQARAGLPPSEPQVGGPLRQGFGEVWRRLDDPTLHRPFRATCWRLLHASLGCNAFLYHVRRNKSDGQSLDPPPLQSAQCGAPSCARAGRLETLSHAFMDCPEVEPVISWLCDTWAALAGPQAAVPRTADFLLADDPAGWGGGLDANLYRMWTRLRVATLGAVWQTRCARLGLRPGESFARRAAKTAVSSLVYAIKRDWLRTTEDPRQLGADAAFCRDWWRGLDARLPRAKFDAQWLRPPVFCDLVGPPPPAGQRDCRPLVFRLSESGPVPLPA